MNSTSIAGFFSKKQYAAIADRAFAMKLLNDRCLECSICAMFFSSSFTVSISALFLSRILSAMLISEFLMLFLTLVTICMPLRKRFSNKACPIYPLSAHSFPFMFSTNRPCFKGSWSSTFSGVNIKFRISPPVIDNKVKFKAEEPTHGAFPTPGKSLEGLVNQYPLIAADTQGSRIYKTDARTTAQQDFLIKMVSGRSTSLSNSTKRL